MSQLDDSPTHEGLPAYVELELELAGQGRYTEMAQLARERAAYMARLPSPAPPSACGSLQRALMLQESVTIELLRRREIVLLQLRRIQQALRTARGYESALHKRQHSRIDASA